MSRTLIVRLPALNGAHRVSVYWNRLPVRTPFRVLVWSHVSATFPRIVAFCAAAPSLLISSRCSCCSYSCFLFLLLCHSCWWRSKLLFSFVDGCALSVRVTKDRIFFCVLLKVTFFFLPCYAAALCCCNPLLLPSLSSYRCALGAKMDPACLKKHLAFFVVLFFFICGCSDKGLPFLFRTFRDMSRV